MRRVDDNVRDAEEILNSVRTDEKGYAVEISGVKFRIEGMGQGRAPDVEPAISLRSREILPRARTAPLLGRSA